MWLKWRIIGRAKRAPCTLGCSIEISRDWASEASPTLGCSIEISRGMSVGMSVVCQINCVGGITCGPRACSKSFRGV